jgi:hypothetical protein
MTSEDIEKAIQAICKKAGNTVGKLAEPAAFSHLVYEQARFHLSHIVGKEAIHMNMRWHEEMFLEKALNLLDKEIEKAVAEAERRHA